MSGSKHDLICEDGDGLNYMVFTAWNIH